MGFYISSSSLISTTLIAFGDAAMYWYSSSLVSALVRSGGFDKYFLISSNAFWHLGVHTKFFAPLRVLKNRRHFFADLTIKRLKAAIFPVSLCTSRTVLEASISITTFIFLGLPLCPVDLPYILEIFPLLY